MHLTSLRRDKPKNGSQQSGFARAVSAHDGNDFARWNFEAIHLQHAAVSGVESEFAQFDDQRKHGVSALGYGGA
jgi:hypothetical protein